MPKLFSKIIVLVLIIIFIYSVTAAYQTYNAEKISRPTVEGVNTSNESAAELTPAIVIKAVDGDTLSVSISGEKETVRIIGIDTPETVDPRKPIQCFGVAASNRAKELLTGKTVGLEKDSSQGETDKYGRLLRYVWLTEENPPRDYGVTTLEGGYAHEYTYDLPYKYQSQYKKAQNEAMVNKRGLWADNACSGPTPTSYLSRPTSPTPNQSTLEGGDRTDTKNCSDFTSHSDAQNYFVMSGGTPEHDIDGLDPDHDGNACESLP